MVGGLATPDPAAPLPGVTSGQRFSCCRRCSISCCLEVSRYSWYRNAGGQNKDVAARVLFPLDVFYLEDQAFCSFISGL